MELVFVALPVALLVGGAALAAFVWAAKSDQFEDLDTPPTRVLFDEPIAEHPSGNADGGKYRNGVIGSESQVSATNTLDRG